MKDDDIDVDENSFDPSKKPRIDHLEDAITTNNGLPILNVGLNDRIVIERNIELDGHVRWFDTRWYVVRKIDHSTGAMTLYDTENKRYAMSNYVTLATNVLYSMKVVEVEKREKSKDEPPLRNVYDDKGQLYTRYKKVKYGPGATTLARPSSKVTVVPRDDGSLQVEDRKMGWRENWKRIA